ncbi:MAG TPA: RNA methyltransferase [Acidimicrobiales bacterium]|nr:RNA methyltransferase [Acidimicrobiales bacterium]
MTVVVDDPSDERVADFVRLNDPAARRRLERAAGGAGLFVAEGPAVVRHLLRSPYRVRSVLVTDRGLRALEADLAAAGAPVYRVTQAVMDAICGFHFHRGALAAADRRPLPPLADVAGRADSLLVVEGVNDHENLGALFRNAAAFGVDAVVLDPTAADPLYRRSVRVSMGHVLRMPFTRVADWPAGLARLRSLGFELLALTPAADARDVRTIGRRARRALLVGSEGAGLSARALAAADRRVRIAMAPGVDSLNVATAAALALHALLVPEIPPGDPPVYSP